MAFQLWFRYIYSLAPHFVPRYASVAVSAGLRIRSALFRVSRRCSCWCLTAPYSELTSLPASAPLRIPKYFPFCQDSPYLFRLLTFYGGFKMLHGLCFTWQSQSALTMSRNGVNFAIIGHFPFHSLTEASRAYAASQSSCLSDSRGVVSDL